MTGIQGGSAHIAAKFDTDLGIKFHAKKAPPNGRESTQKTAVSCGSGSGRKHAISAQHQRQNAR